MRASLLSVLAFGVCLAACEPDANAQYPDLAAPADAPGDASATPAIGPADAALNNEVGAGDPIHDAVIAAANTTLAEQIGQPVAIQPEIFRSEGEWAFVYGPVRKPDGTALDWSTTAMADAAAEGMMDGDLGIVLLNWLDGEWRVVEAAVGPTDVPQVAWPDEHHVSPALVGLEGG